jgi:hypothetical protein
VVDWKTLLDNNVEMKKIDSIIRKFRLADETSLKKEAIRVKD